MPTFTALNRDWSIRFDGLLLGELRDATDIDLADVGGESWLKMETDQAALTRAVCFLCREQLTAASMTAKQLADALCGETAEAAYQALWGATKVFFRPKLMSVLESALSQQRTLAEVRPMLAMMDSLPSGMREAAMEELTRKLGGSESCKEQPSASGQAATLSTLATATPAPAALAPAA